MTDQDTHEPTPEEDALYALMTEGDWEAIDQARQDAYEAGEGEQFEEDYTYAWLRYQADHEAPESERILNTEAEVHEQNAMAETIEAARGG
jgi:hypothetical protein